MAKITLVGDTLNEATVRFAPPPIATPIFLNALQKSGTHLLRNIMIPVITIIGLEFGSVVAFSVVTETIFAWPGMGKLIIDSIHVLDRPMIVAYLMIIVLLFVVINLLVDCLYTVLDPRVRVSR